MRFIGFNGAYLNCDHIESIREINGSTSKVCVVTMVSGGTFQMNSSGTLTKAVLDKVLDSSGGFKTK